MKQNKFFILVFLFLFHLGKLFSQSEHYPIRIEERMEVVKESSSKYGTQLKKKAKIVIIYNDSSTEVATHRKMNELVASVQQAQSEWKKHNANRVYEVSSIPLFALGFWGAYNLSKGEKQSQNALLSIVGLGGGYLLFEHFDWQKKRNLKKIMTICNDYWSQKEKGKEFNKFIKPDVIRIGAVHQNNIGIGMTWYITP